MFVDGIAEHARLTGKLREQAGLLERMADAIISTLEAGGRIYTFGNGGSAADAQHIAAELVGRFHLERKGLPAVALTTDSSNLLSIGNDYGFTRVFTRQVEALVRAGDLVWALSTSGNSANVVGAVEVARGIGTSVIGFTGRTGGKLKSLCDHCLCVDGETSDRIQEIHQVGYHLICQAVELHFANRS
jgi:D-sedoheptulose 7-phosphate isomerase